MDRSQQKRREPLSKLRLAAAFLLVRCSDRPRCWLFLYVIDGQNLVVGAPDLVGYGDIPSGLQGCQSSLFAVDPETALFIDDEDHILVLGSPDGKPAGIRLDVADQAGERQLVPPGGRGRSRRSALALARGDDRADAPELVNDRHLVTDVQVLEPDWMLVLHRL